MTTPDFSRLSKKPVSEFSIDELWVAKRIFDAGGPNTGGTLSLAQQQMKAEIDRELDKPCEPLRIPGQSSPQKPPGTLAYRNASGAWVSAKSHGEPLREQHGDVPGLGDIIRAQALGDWKPLGEQAASIRESVDSSGGVIVPQTISTGIIDLARSRSVLSAAGMKTIAFPELGDSLRIGKVKTDPTAYWRVEGGAITASSPTFEALVLTPKVCAILLPVSIEWLSDVANAQQLLESVIANALAAEIDRACLYGTGAAGEPSGLSTMAGINAAPAVGAWNIDSLVNWMETLWTANCQSTNLSVILHPDGESHRLKLKDGDGSYYYSPGSNPIQTLQYLVTTNCTSTDLFIGDFSRCLMAVKDRLRVEVLAAGTGTDAAGTTFNACSEMYRWVRVYARLDTHCEYPSHLYYCSGLTNS